MGIEEREAEHGQILHWVLTRPKASGTTDLDIAARPATHAQFPGPTAMCIVAGKDVELKVKPSAKRVGSVRKDLGRMRLELVWH